MKLALAFLIAFAVVIPSALSIKCYICFGSSCTGPSRCILGDTCFTTTYKNTSRVVKGCTYGGACNLTMAGCTRAPDYCSALCCTTDGCNGSGSGSIQINVAMVSMMALFAVISYFFNH